MDRLVKYVYLTLKKNEFPTFLGLISFVVWELKNYRGILVLLVLYSYVGIIGILLVDNCNSFLYSG